MLDDVPQHFGIVVAVAVGAIVVGSLAQIWINRFVAAVVATGVSAGVAWLLIREIEYVGAIAAVVFLVTLVMVRAFFESWRGD
jgi:hypothetical protein